MSRKLLEFIIFRFKEIDRNNNLKMNWCLKVQLISQELHTLDSFVHATANTFAAKSTLANNFGLKSSIHDFAQRKGGTATGQGKRLCE